MALERYHAKRRFDVTSEPRGKKGSGKGNAFVIQKHAARRLHYDLRLELDGVMKSWAITRGPSLVPGDKRLAMHVEDHPIEYNQFEGTIPQGQYGGGTVMIWDRGEWFPEGDPREAYAKGHLDFRLEGDKLGGSWHLVRMRKREGERQDPWLLIKAGDAVGRTARDPDVLEEKPLSVASGRSMDEIAAGKPVKKKSARAALPAAAVWSSTADPAVAMTAGPVPATDDRSSAKSGGAARKKPASAGVAGNKSATVKSAKRARAGAHSAPMPDFVEPCLALPSGKPMEGAHWVHEVKFDGYRMQARVADGKVRLTTRRGLDWTDKFSPVAAALRQFPAREAMIDGEIVVETQAGVASFSALQEALKAGGGKFVFYVFDLLFVDGADLRDRPLVERKRRLAELVHAMPDRDSIRYSEHFDVQGAVLLQHACQLTLEGIVSKLRDAPYGSGRNGDWVKSKCSDRQEFVVIGYALSTADPRGVGALLLGYYESGELRYAGRVGTGFTHAGARNLWDALQPLRAKQAPVRPLPTEERGRKPIWVEPKLVAEVDFRGWTHGMRLRHPSFKGLREDKLATEVVREAPAATTAAENTPAAPGAPDPAVAEKPKRKTKAGTAPPTRAAVPATPTGASTLPDNAHLTNPDRVYWPEVGLTKKGLAEYYVQVWDWMAPHVVGRALSLVRCPEGTVGQCFYQKHASAGLDAKHLHLVPEDGDHVISIKDVTGLLALVQAGVLEVHVRGSTVDRLDASNRIVLDLDPAPDVGWPEVVRAARDVRERLDALGLQSWLKTTGGKGLHVVVPTADTPWDEVKAFTHAFADAMAADSPSRYVAIASKRARTGRIFVDYLRNSREATAICAYSTRARAGATVSVPIDWAELSALKAPNQYTVANLMQRLRRLKADPWADIGQVRQQLPSAAAVKK